MRREFAINAYLSHNNYLQTGATPGLKIRIIAQEVKQPGILSIQHVPCLNHGS
jgi:hypothetical protein